MTTPAQLTSTELQERLKAGSLAGNWTVDPAWATSAARGRYPRKAT